MTRRLPASQRTREELTSLIEGRLSTGSAKDELIVEEALDGEAGDAVGRGITTSMVRSPAKGTATATERAG